MKHPWRITSPRTQPGCAACTSFRRATPRAKRTWCKPGDAYRTFYIGDDRLNGFVILGDCARAGIYTALVRNRTKLSTLDFALLREKPQLMAFSRVERAEQLGGKSI